MTFKKISIVKFFVVGLAMLMMTSFSLAQVTVDLPIVSGLAGTSVVAPVTINNLTGGVNSGQARIYVGDATVAKISDVKAAGLSEGTSFTVNPVSASEIRVSWASSTEITGSTTLFNVTIEYLSTGSTPITTTDPNTSQERLRVFNDNGEIALTVNDGMANVPSISILIPDDLSDYAGSDVMIPVNTTAIASAEGISAYQFTLTYDPSVVSITGYELANTLSTGGSANINVDADAGSLSFAWSTAGTLSGESAPPLVYLVGKLVGTGSSDLEFTSFRFDKMLGGIINPATFDGKITVLAFFKVSGSVLYANSEGLAGAEVSLSGDASATATSDADGAYSFADLLPGSYAVTAAPVNAWGANSAADALVASLYVSDPVANPLSAMQMMAADVNNSGDITNADALTILNRVVGKIDAYTIADWQVVGDDNVTITNADATADVTAICAGDVNMNYSTAAAKSVVNVSYSDQVSIADNGEFVYSISAGQYAEVGAYTFKLKFDNSKLEFVGIDSKLQNISNVKDNVVAIAWADFSGGKNNVKFESGSKIVSIRFKAKGLGNESAAVELIEGTEVVDANGYDINMALVVPSSVSNTPDSFVLNQNYPNPFNPTTTISFSIPFAGKVSLAVYNSLGQKVSQVIDNSLEAGSYEFNFDASNLTSGTYFYRITVAGQKEYSMTKKMLLMK